MSPTKMRANVRVQPSDQNDLEILCICRRFQSGNWLNLQAFESRS